jgi:hypothetical protein
MSEGSTALIMITVVVGTYAGYRYYKKSEKEKSADKSVAEKSAATRTGMAVLTRGYYTGACASEFTAPDPRHTMAPYAGFYAGARGGAQRFHERMPHAPPDDQGGSDGDGGDGDGGGGGGGRGHQQFPHRGRGQQFAHAQHGRRR